MDIKGILKFYNIDIEKERDSDYDCLCPFHNDDHTSFSIHKTKGVWLCRAGCGSGNIVQLIMRLDKCSREEANKKIEKFSNRVDTIVERIRSKRNSNFTMTVFDHPEVKLPAEYIPFENKLEPNIYYNYVYARIGIDTAIRFKLGYCPTGFFKNRIIIPIILNKKIIGFTGRSLYHTGNRYMLSYKFPSNSSLFCYDEPTDGSAYLSESIFDTLTLYRWGFSSIYATFGAHISYNQILLLIRKGVKHLKILFHNDKAGITGVQDALPLLKVHFSIEIGVMPEDKDINEMTLDEFNNIEWRKIDDKIDRIKRRLKWKQSRS